MYQGIVPIMWVHFAAHFAPYLCCILYLYPPTTTAVVIGQSFNFKAAPSDKERINPIATRVFPLI